MSYQLSEQDREFVAQFESCSYPIERFDHGAHLKLAYVYLVEADVETACEQMRSALLRFLEFNRVDVSKYHATLTRAWILAVRHFMEKTLSSESAASFVETNSMMLDADLMLTHYSAELLFSDEARAQFVEPDLDLIPRYEV